MVKIDLIFCSIFSFIVLVKCVPTVDQLSNELREKILETLYDHELQNFGLDREKRATKNLESETYHKLQNKWVARIEGGIESAQKVVENAGFRIDKAVLGIEDTYEILPSATIQHRVKRSTPDYEMPDSVQIKFVDRQVILSRQKRFSIDRTFNEEQQTYDYGPMWSYQKIYMGSMSKEKRSAQGFRVESWDLREIWSRGISGFGVSISILDDGLDCGNIDLTQNCDPSLHYNAFTDENKSPPRYEITEFNKHGTYIGGVMAAKRNHFCGIGIAPNSRIGGVNMLDGTITDSIEGKGIGRNAGKTDITVACWGPNDDGKTTEGSGRLATEAIEKHIRLGRGGKGTLMVWAGGNGRKHDDANCDGYVNSIYTIAVTACTKDGRSPSYSEIGSVFLTTTYSSNNQWNDYLVTTGLLGKCEKYFPGTSSSAPIIAGFLALVLQENPEIWWRDAQYIVILASSPQNLDDYNWIKNGANLMFSHYFGFGIASPNKMVELARNWELVPEVITCNQTLNLSTAFASGETVRFKFEDVCGSSDGKIASLETVVLDTTLTHTNRGKLVINITSPQGTTATLLHERPRDHSKEGLDAWGFLSVAHWGEDPDGVWIASVSDKSSSGQYGNGTVKRLKLELRGTKEVPKVIQERRKGIHR